MKIFESRYKSVDDFQNSILDFEGTLEEKIDNCLLSLTEIKLDEELSRSMYTKVFDQFAYSASFPRKGDVNERYDILLQKDNKFILGEIEIPTNAILDAPRNLLDDLAVFSNRRKVPIENIQLLVISWDIPNNRTDYWNVINDIEKILGIKIFTISLIALLILFWTNNNFKITEYFLTAENNKLETIVQILNENGIKTEKYLGYFSPIK